MKRKAAGGSGLGERDALPSPAAARQGYRIMVHLWSQSPPPPPPPPPPKQQQQQTTPPPPRSWSQAASQTPLPLAPENNNSLFFLVAANGITYDTWPPGVQQAQGLIQADCVTITGGRQNKTSGGGISVCAYDLVYSNVSKRWTLLQEAGREWDGTLSLHSGGSTPRSSILSNHQAKPVVS